MMDEVGEPAHIPDISWDLFESKFSTCRWIGIDGAPSLPRHDDNMILTLCRWALDLVAKVLPRKHPYGDNHAIVLSGRMTAQ